MNGFERRRQAKKDEILAVAFDLFRSNGLEGAKVSEIAEKAHVSKVSIYKYFGSKEELAKQVMFAYMDKKAEEFKNLIQSDRSFKEKFDLMYSGKMNSLDDLTDGRTEGITDNAILASPQVQEFLIAYAETKIKPVFIDFIEQGKREGEIDGEISTESILLYIQALHGILSSPITMKQRVDIGKLYFFGLKGKEPTR